MQAMRPSPRAARPWWPRPVLRLVSEQQVLGRLALATGFVRFLPMPLVARRLSHRAPLPGPFVHARSHPETVGWAQLWVRPVHRHGVPQHGVPARTRLWATKKKALMTMLLVTQPVTRRIEAPCPNAFGAPLWLWVQGRWQGAVAGAPAIGFAQVPPAERVVLEFAKPSRLPSPSTRPHAAPAPPKSNATKPLMSDHWPER
jgi:hypothetical protein